jgi:3D (Asp-Asp-Asp) domain-containing protein
MRMKLIINLILLLVLCPTAKAGTYSSKSTFSKSLHPKASGLATRQGRLACLTAYWPGEDHYTNRKLSSTGVLLRDGYCAVDSSIIPYGSVVTILGLGSYVAVDTGTAVIARKAAKESGHTSQERSALVIDLYFASRQAGEFFSREGPKFAMVAWEIGGTAIRD